MPIPAWPLTASTTATQAEEALQKLRAYGLSDHYKQIFALTRLDEAIGIYDSEAEAVSAP